MSEVIGMVGWKKEAVWCDFNAASFFSILTSCRVFWCILIADLLWINNSGMFSCLVPLSVNEANANLNSGKDQTSKPAWKQESQSASEWRGPSCRSKMGSKQDTGLWVKKNRKAKFRYDAGLVLQAGEEMSQMWATKRWDLWMKYGQTVTYHSCLWLSTKKTKCFNTVAFEWICQHQ